MCIIQIKVSLYIFFYFIFRNWVSVVCTLSGYNDRKLLFCSVCKALIQSAAHTCMSSIVCHKRLPFFSIHHPPSQQSIHLTLLIISSMCCFLAFHFVVRLSLSLFIIIILFILYQKRFFQIIIEQKWKLKFITISSLFTNWRAFHCSAHVLTKYIVLS
jgi:hypothetical protein